MNIDKRLPHDSAGDDEATRKRLLASIERILRPTQVHTLSDGKGTYLTLYPCGCQSAEPGDSRHEYCTSHAVQP